MMYAERWEPMLRDSILNGIGIKNERKKSWKCTFFLRPSNYDLTRLLSSSSGMNER